MCGIAGSVNFSPDIAGLTRALLHRGPDEQATFTEGRLVLHHHRLSIVDIASGKQPMHWNDRVIIFNGEIYNHLEVRKKLGLQCQTQSDTETILHAYAKAGPACLSEFDGMFSFAIYDRTKQELFLARDRAGKKPLFYFHDGKSFMFASELNAIRSQLPLEIDHTAIGQYLRAGYFFSPGSPYKTVQRIPAGSYALLKLDDLSMQISRWWDIHDHYNHSSGDDFQTALDKTDTLLRQAVNRRIDSSDLEVGSFLSGGIDSGLVTALASQHKSSVKTFTVSFAGAYDEAPLARQVAEQYGTDHEEIHISFDHLRDDVEQIISNYGMPFFDSSAIPSYYVSREARKHLTVILNGDGGDELFGGYRRYVPFSKYDFFSPGPLVRSVAGMIYPLLPVSHDKKSKYNYLYRLAGFARKKGLDTYFSSTLDIFDGHTDAFLFDESAVLDNIRQSFERINSSGLSGLKKILNLDFDHILEANLLVKMDIATMANSLEGRSPLLSKELLEYIPGLPDQYKIKGAQTKYLLRSLAEKYLPADLIHQPKRGFEIPLKQWIDGELKDIVADYILSPDASYRQYIDPRFVQDLWNRNVKTGDEKRAKMIWTIFALEVWYRKCYLKK